MLLTISQILTLPIILYFFGKSFFKIMTKINIIEKNINGLLIYLFLSIVILNNLVILKINLNIILLLIYLISVIYFCIFFFSLNKKNLKLEDIKIKFILIFIPLIIFFKIIIEPITLWDARSIWFYSAKIIYFNDGYLFENFQDAFCNKCDYLIYPKLLPALSSVLAKYFGFWNDYLPKLSLFLLFIPAYIFLIKEFDSFYNRILSVILIMFSTGFFLWNGYVDGYLAIYCAIAYYCLTKIINVRSDYYFLIFLFSSYVILNLKLESIFFFISILTFFLIKNFIYNFIYLFKKNLILIFLIFFSSIYWYLTTLTEFNSIPINKNNKHFINYDLLKIFLNELFSYNQVLGNRFSSYIKFIFTFLIYESKLIYYFLFQFIIIFYFNYFKIPLGYKNNFIHLNFVPFFYFLFVLLFYFYWGFDRSLNGLKDALIANFDRTTLPIKIIFSMNILVMVSEFFSYKSRIKN